MKTYLFDFDGTLVDSMPVYGVFDETSAEYSQEIRAVTDKYVTNFIELLDEWAGQVWGFLIKYTKNKTQDASKIASCVLF